MWRTLSWTEPKEFPGQMIGAIPAFIASIIKGEPTFIRGGLLPDITQFAFTIIVFLIVVYFESMRIEIPLSYGRFKGVRGRYPIRFIYASNIPVILAVSMFGTMTLVAKLTFHKLGWTFFGDYDEQGNVRGGLMYFLSPPRSLDMLLVEWDRALIYLIVLVAVCVLFAVLWIEMTNMGPKAVAKQLQQSGMQIPGFRKDIRIVEKVLERYIPQVTVMGGIAVGFLSAIADFTGALGTGTGILLTVGIVFRMYEDLMREQVSEMFPALRGFLER
jgi:preprotein translocase subunit SecY